MKKAGIGPLFFLKKIKASQFFGEEKKHLSTPPPNNNKNKFQGFLNKRS